MTKKTLCAVESFTGGLFASEIVKIPGASTFFKGALVTYQTATKAQFHIDTSHGVISAATAQSMALRGRELFQTDYCVAFTGNAGPTALEGQPVGRVFVAINQAVYALQLPGDRNAVRGAAVKFALEKIEQLL